MFVLREVFGLEYDEIAGAVDKKPPAVRQIAHRARAHVAARRPRETVSPDRAREALAAFRRAVETGDPRRLLDLIAPDVVLLTDGGGVVPAALEPVVGATPVIRLLTRISTTLSLRPAQINGHPALLAHRSHDLDTVLALRLDTGRIAGLYAVRNPEKLSRVGRETAMSR